jgi:arylsulfatase A-like enzyme
MRCNALLFGSVVALASGFASLKAEVARAAQPNVVIIYADDFGWGETGVQGCKDIPTPNIDSIAKNGLRFTQGYVAATYCSPSRAGLMTGRYPTRFGHEFNAAARRGGLSLKETTLAKRLKDLGYATACVGKWHLGDSPDYYPTARGFDEFYGTLANTPFYHPTNFIDSRKANEVTAIEDKEFYTTDAYGERAVDWIGKQAADKPWFLYLPFNAQHAPLQAPQKYLDRFPNITDEKRKYFAAMLTGMDDAVGRVLEKIRDSKQEERTIIWFIGDNGGPTQSTSSQNGPLRGFKMTTFEGGPRVPFFAQWKGTFPAGKTYDLPVMNLDVMPTVVAAAGGNVSADDKVDGVDLLAYVTGKNEARPHEKMFWRFGEQWAARSGDWKLVVSRGGSGKPELYNLADDIGESKDLATAEPAKVAELQKLYDAWNAEQAEPSAVDQPRTAGGKKKKNAKQEAKKPGARKKKAAAGNAE